MLLSRLIKNKLNNHIITKGNKISGDILVKKVIKKLLKNNKKSFKKIMYLALNLCLPVFKLNRKKAKIKNQKLFKMKPSFILKNKTKNRISHSLKTIIYGSKIKKPKLFYALEQEFVLFFSSKDNYSIKKKILEYEQIITYQTTLIFYRW